MQEGSGETIGVYLRNVRLNRKIALQEVSDVTGISLGILQALEEEDKERLPADVYIKAFYKKYADFLELPSEEFSTLSSQQNDGREAKQDTRFNFQTVVELKNPDENAYSDSIRLLAIAAMIILLGVFFYWAYKTNFNPLDLFGYLPEMTETKDFSQLFSV
jgi:cytoskeleton protein RodZ